MMNGGRSNYKGRKRNEDDVRMKATARSDCEGRESGMANNWAGQAICLTSV